MISISEHIFVFKVPILKLWHAKCARGPRLCSGMGIAQVYYAITLLKLCIVCSLKYKQKEIKICKFKPHIGMAYSGVARNLDMGVPPGAKHL